MLFCNQVTDFLVTYFDIILQSQAPTPLPQLAHTFLLGCPCKHTKRRFDYSLIVGRTQRRQHVQAKYNIRAGAHAVQNVICLLTSLLKSL